MAEVIHPAKTIHPISTEQVQGGVTSKPISISNQISIT